MKASELIDGKRKHLGRFTNSIGASGERALVLSQDNWVERPRGREIKILLSCLEERNIRIKASSFDAIQVPEEVKVDFSLRDSVAASLSVLKFIEIKTSSKVTVDADFNGFYFSISEAELLAAEALGDQYVVALHHKVSQTYRFYSMDEIFRRRRSLSWQVSIQI
jgi:hypothetical protein